MKSLKLFAALGVAAVALFLTGCSDSPKDVANKWKDAVTSGDVKTANQYSTERVHVLNGLIGASCQDSETPKELKALRAFNFDKEEISGSKATVWDSSKGKSESFVTLVKNSDEWKVDIEKE